MRNWRFIWSLSSSARMKLYALYMYRVQGEKAVLLDKAQDFKDVSFVYRKNAVELCDLAAENLALSPKPDRFMTAQEKQFMFFTHKKDGVVAIVIATEDYPSRVAFSILREMMTEFEQCHGRYTNGKSEVIQRGISEYQKPSNADKLLKIQENLEETKQIMTQNLEIAIGRGMTLDELAAKSENISESSKMFAREAKKMNKCCTVI